MTEIIYILPEMHRISSFAMKWNSKTSSDMVEKYNDLQIHNMKTRMNSAHYGIIPESLLSYINNKLHLFPPRLNFNFGRAFFLLSITSCSRDFCLRCSSSIFCFCSNIFRCSSTNFNCSSANFRWASSIFLLFSSIIFSNSKRFCLSSSYKKG